MRLRLVKGGELGSYSCKKQLFQGFLQSVMNISLTEILFFLDLSECELTQIPDAVYVMLKETTVQSCDLSKNLLQNLPKKFCSKFSKVTGKHFSTKVMQILA